MLNKDSTILETKPPRPTFGRIRKAIHTNWWLFAANNDSRLGVFSQRALLVGVPILIGLGFFITLFHVASLFMAILVGVIITLLIGFVMTRTTPEAERRVEHYLSEDLYIDSSEQYHPSTSLIPETQIKPVFYQGVGEWMAPGHVPIKEFITTIQTLDTFVDSIEYRQLEDLVEYSYAVNTYSPRRKMPALKLTDQTEPESYPLTRLRAPYDNYVSNGEYPINMPPSPSLAGPAFDIPEEEQ